jgi:ribosomal protein S18 acetylase RimI-like enzyme
MPNKYSYKKATINDLHLIAEWIVKTAQIPSQHCIHSWAGESAEEVAEGLISYFNDGELLYILAYHKDKLIGSMGMEFDEDMGAAWVHGPLIDILHRDACINPLYKKALNELPADIKELRAYLNTENKASIKFYQELGYTKKDHVSYVYQLPAKNKIPLNLDKCILLDNKHEADFLHLYHTLFPDPYYSGKRILEMRDKSHEVFIVLEDEIFAGFVVICLDENEIQFLGVETGQRQKGLGKALLSCGINYLFDINKGKCLSLNVSGDLENAQILYQSVGFSLQYSGIGLTKIL